MVCSAGAKVSCALLALSTADVYSSQGPCGASLQATARTGQLLQMPDIHVGAFSSTGCLLSLSAQCSEAVYRPHEVMAESLHTTARTGEPSAMCTLHTQIELGT